MLRGRQAWQLPSRWRLHSHWRTHVSADLLKGFDNTCPERHRLIRWWCISSARAGLIRTIGTAHQPVARWRVRTEVFALMIGATCGTHNALLTPAAQWKHQAGRHRLSPASATVASTSHFLHTRDSQDSPTFLRHQGGAACHVHARPLFALPPAYPRATPLNPGGADSRTDHFRSRRGSYRASS